jgi:hypothetical protein
MAAPARRQCAFALAQEWPMKWDLRVRGAIALLAVAACGAAAAADERHPWIATPAMVQPPTTYFVNLRDGDRIETPFVVKFGLSRYGLAPIVSGVPHTGHHHMLVNRDLPLDFKQPLPFNDQYVHFGKGQMETVLTFPPGTYTLRLLLADHKHIPHFIYSKPVTVTVEKKNEAVDPKTLVKAGVQLLEPRSGAVVQGAFKVQFHASGLNVSHTGLKEAGTGHFALVAQRAGKPDERIVFAGGATEAWLKPPAGDYVMRLQFVRNAAPNDVMAVSEPVSVTVGPSAY